MQTGYYSMPCNRVSMMHSLDSERHEYGAVQNTIDLSAVVEGMDVVKKIETKGSGSGKPSAKVTIVKSGEL